eukprot:10285325-Alexandrium_andersonii.AAC.1
MDNGSIDKSVAGRRGQFRVGFEQFLARPPRQGLSPLDLQERFPAPPLRGGYRSCLSLIHI